MENKQNQETPNVVLDEDDIDLEDIEHSLHSISLDTCYKNPDIRNYIDTYKQDAFHALEDDLKQVLYDFHMEEEYHIYFLDMIRHHVHKDFDDRAIIRDNPVVLEYMNNNDVKKHTFTKPNQVTENTFKLYDWNGGMYKKETN